MINDDGENKSNTEEKAQLGLEESQSLDDRLNKLDAALTTRRGKIEQETGETKKTGSYGQAFKISSEFIAGILVGAGMGWLVDSFFSSSPWGLIVFLMLGFLAGILNVLRTTGQVAEFGQMGSQTKPSDDHEIK